MSARDSSVKCGKISFRHVQWGHQGIEVVAIVLAVSLETAGKGKKNKDKEKKREREREREREENKLKGASNQVAGSYLHTFSLPLPSLFPFLLSSPHECMYFAHDAIFSLLLPLFFLFLLSLLLRHRYDL